MKKTHQYCKELYVWCVTSLYNLVVRYLRQIIFPTNILVDDLISKCILCTVDYSHDQDLTSTCVSEPLTYDHFNVCLLNPDIWPLQRVSLNPWHMTTYVNVCLWTPDIWPLQHVSLNPWHMTTYVNVCLWTPDMTTSMCVS